MSCHLLHIIHHLVEFGQSERGAFCGKGIFHWRVKHQNRARSWAIGKMPVWCLNIFCPAALSRSVSGCCHSEWWEWSCCRSINRERRGDPEELSPGLWFPAGEKRFILWLLIYSDITCSVACLSIQYGRINQTHGHLSPGSLLWWIGNGLSMPEAVNEEQPRWVGCCSPVRSQTETERASCFHTTDSDLSSEVPESYALPAERASLLFTHW